jgi:hypothetical protein
MLCILDKRERGVGDDNDLMHVVSGQAKGSRDPGTAEAQGHRCPGVEVHQVRQAQGRNKQLNSYK